MHPLIKVGIASSLLCVLGSAQAGVIVGGTRVVYDASKKEAALSVKNPETDPPYLIQSWVEPGADAKKAPFVITPPLFRLDSGQENVLRIMSTSNDLPKDRESVYWLDIKSIPASKKTDENQLQISVKNRIKLFYRPVGLAGNTADAYKQLTFTRSGSQLSVNNPTPYYVSFYSLKLGNVEIKDPEMVAPHGRLSWAIPAASPSSVTWQAINDHGGISAAASQNL